MLAAAEFELDQLLAVSSFHSAVHMFCAGLLQRCREKWRKAGVTKEFSAESVLCCLLVDCEEAKSYLAALVVHAFVYNICYRTVTFICRVRWLHDVQHSRH